MGEQSTGTAGNESYIYNYDKFADLLDNSWGSFSPTQIGWSSGFATAGLAYETVPAPEPSVTALICLGLAALGFTSRKKRKALNAVAASYIPHSPVDCIPFKTYSSFGGCSYLLKKLLNSSL